MKYPILASLLAAAALVVVGAIPTVTMAAEPVKPAAKSEKAESYEKAAKSEKAEKGETAAQEKREEKAEKGEKAEWHTLKGVISAVEPTAKSLVVKAKEKDGKELTLGLSVTDRTRIHEGKAKKTLADLKVGDHGRVNYVREHNGDMARSIAVLSEAKYPVGSRDDRSNPCRPEPGLSNGK